MNFLVQPERVVSKCESINGFSVISEGIPTSTLMEIATSVVIDWTDWWDDGEGFGSSDFTYLVKDFIDEVIGHAGFRGKYETKFTPRLSVVEYSEAEHHERVWQWESGQ